MKNTSSIIVKRVKKVSGGHHGGAWKVAFADFATAMMAFFMVLWLSASTSKEVKEAVQGYFQDPIGFTEGGSPSPVDLEGSATINPQPSEATLETPTEVSEEQVKEMAKEIEQQELEEVKQNILDQIEGSATLKQFKDQLLIDMTEEGLRIQIVDRSKRPMFDSGKAELKSYSEDVLYELAKVLAKLPNKLKLTGHTDGLPFGTADSYSNWELSSERANAARRALVIGGVEETKLSEVVGLGSSVLFDPKNPEAPINRRIGIIVLNKEAASQVEKDAGGYKGEVEEESGSFDPANPDAPPAPAPTPQPESGAAPAPGDAPAATTGESPALPAETPAEDGAKDATRKKLEDGSWFNDVQEVNPDEVRW